VSGAQVRRSTNRIPRPDSLGRRAAFGGLGLLLVVAAAVVPASTRRAEADTPPASTISITERIRLAQAGDTIVVSAGVYREQLVIDKPVTLIGEGRPVIDGGRAGDVVLVRAPGTTIRGFEIRGSAQDVLDEPAAIRVRADRATIEDNRIVDCLYGVMLEDSNDHRIVGNQISSIEGLSPERRGHALSLWHTDRNLVTGNVTHGSKDGIFVGFSTQNRIEGNRVTDARYGIHYMYADHNVFADNTFEQSVAGAAIMFSRDITFRGNEFASNRSVASGYGLLFKDVDDVSMTDNVVRDNRIGIILEGAPHTPGATVTLRGNVIGSNDVGLELASTTQVTFTENVFRGNLEHVTLSGGDVSHRNAWSFEDRGNYWDDYQGYDANGDGIGDIPFRYEGAFDHLAKQEPWVRTYSFTPARTALELAASWFPVFRPAPRAVDPFPLMSARDALASSALSPDHRSQSLGIAAALLALPFALWWSTWRRGARW